ncbi:unnamed protein product [Phaedon cochleariae]|uniref:Uncharacterized protein n=1 Tax=Phaedon cochleariae TaxID=80249 RepID=A0A9N9WZL1_PHACE|nr:unnamed protein product [Phaedon cochleariae]
MMTNCRREYRCVKCGEPHPTSTCPKPRHTDATCANCKGKHPANFRGCPKTPKLPTTAATKPTTKPAQKPRTRQATAASTTIPGKSYANATSSTAQAKKRTSPPAQPTPPGIPQEHLAFMQQSMQQAMAQAMQILMQQTAAFLQTSVPVTDGRS